MYILKKHYKGTIMRLSRYYKDVLSKHIKFRRQVQERVAVEKCVGHAVKSRTVDNYELKWINKH